MTKEQLEALIAFIDAKIAEALDDHNSADEGLISGLARAEAEKHLREVLLQDL